MFKLSGAAAPLGPTASELAQKVHDAHVMSVVELAKLAAAGVCDPP